ncbi:dynein regulatory complex subunit 4 [Silurus meridionalis]|uniref:Dynein regulatory complex subunit 4 n=2 Tax=cellular organisms TaxID=131567 RepID=A0A8T0B1G0_SILME|nr:dynein regulatory complex subunit 4 [Silurus meridionalis]KAF7699371.1 hypothetical protein HF521_004113 [Silurus meridionalis]
MPPKKKKAPKAAKEKSRKVVDALPTEEMSKEQLEEHIARLREELDREREERNYFQLERDKIHTFWEISKKQLEEKKADLRNRDREMEEAEENHQTEIRVYKQKVKHLLYEQQNSITELKSEGVVAIKLLEKEQADQENELRKGLRSLKIDLREKELSNENHIKNLKLSHDEQITKLRSEFEERLREIEAAYEKKMQTQRQEQDLRRKTEIHELEQRKSIHVNTMIKNHEKAFSDIKNYYSDVTLGNMNQINMLKDQLADMKKREERLENEMATVVHQNKLLKEPLQKASQEVSELQKQLTNYKKDKNLLAGLKARLKVVEQEQKDLKWEHEVLEQRFSKVQQERDELYQKFTKAVLEVQQRSGFKNLLLERKLDALTEVLEKKEAQLNEVLAASNLEPSALNVLTRKLEDVLDSKNVAIKDLQYELARMCKAHNDLLRTYKVKLQAFGIPVEELGFKPLESNLMKQSLGQGPAGLVSSPL